MSHQRPIFQNGLYGKANQIVMNGLLDAADAVVANSPGIYAAQQLLLEQRQSLRCFLARLETATAVGGLPGQYHTWTYAGRPWVLSHLGVGSPGSFVNDSADAFSAAINLRELFNYDNPLDGMDPSAPGVVAGPVGSKWMAANVWSTANLQAVVLMYTTTTSNGTPIYFFDRPNPVRCTETSFEFVPPE